MKEEKVVGYSTYEHLRKAKLGGKKKKLNITLEKSNDELNTEIDDLSKSIKKDINNNMNDFSEKDNQL